MKKSIKLLHEFNFLKFLNYESLQISAILILNFDKRMQI
jgi:hypothetical protein